MRFGALAAMTVTMLACSAPANALLITQNISGSSSAGSQFQLFDPTLGPLAAVIIDVTVGSSNTFINPGGGVFDTPVPVTGGGTLTLGRTGQGLLAVSVSGAIDYHEGETFATCYASGSASATITSPAALNGFVGTGSTFIYGGPGSGCDRGIYRPSNFFSGTITYDYAVPEPATWAMLLIGFGGIGAALRKLPKPALAYIPISTSY